MTSYVLAWVDKDAAMHPLPFEFSMMHWAHDTLQKLVSNGFKQPLCICGCVDGFWIPIY